eukprot:11027025-Alexandrium_andersonii.AAC.1
MSAGRCGTPSATAALEAACEEAAKSRSCDALAALRAAKASQDTLSQLALAARAPCKRGPLSDSVAVGWSSDGVSRSSEQELLTVRLGSRPAAWHH